MRAGDLGRDLRERGIALPVVVEPVFEHDHGMGLSGPFAHQPSARFERDSRIEDPCTLCFDLGDQAAQFSLGRRTEPAMRALLQPVGERPDHQIAGHAARRLAATEPPPRDLQLMTRQSFQ